MSRPLPRVNMRNHNYPFLSKLLACAGILSMLAAARAAGAEGPPTDQTVDVQLHEAPSPHRFLTIEWNPLALFIDRISVNAVIVPGDHHALVLSPFYTWANTAEYSTGLAADGTPLGYTLNVPKQDFDGFGGEIGYRYYASKGGPRGFFAGPSLILESITAKSCANCSGVPALAAYHGSQTSFTGYGLALDVGYEALIDDTIAVSVGVGAQYTATSQTIPPQQLPASIYANDKFYPRMLLSLGYAF